MHITFTAIVFEHPKIYTTVLNRKGVVHYLNRSITKKDEAMQHVFNLYSVFNPNLNCPFGKIGKSRGHVEARGIFTRRHWLLVHGRYKFHWTKQLSSVVSELQPLHTL